MTDRILLPLTTPEAHLVADAAGQYAEEYADSATDAAYLGALAGAVRRSIDPAEPEELRIGHLPEGYEPTIDIVPPITDEVISDEREHQYSLGYDTTHDQRHGLIHVLSYALDYAKRGEHVKGWAMVQAALDAMPTSKRVDVWPISIFIGEEQATANAMHRAELATMGLLHADQPPADLAERIIAQMPAGEMPADEARENAGYPKAASAHHGLADASVIADRIAAEQARREAE
ncbi:hypothetical protein SEA_MEMENTOMORI_92 [Microbacterium phage MementoMori]|uniref:Uncharacterized protein n=1 Tax=Microbacterium phage MementoMori TaxID=2201436 RepID=A0A2Z4Q5L4_9CAUD|nr:hypothetical protein HOT41_gp17 [Microbacterium phage MementoMori]AWY05346.1 hypothetical protein SEA_MEMENTOMORI_92 [Microbacterium phage MementoMori]